MLSVCQSLLYLNAAFFFPSFISSSACVGRDPLASPLSSFTPWTNSSVSDGFSPHHASLRSHSFARHLRGFKGQKKRERKTTGNVKEIFQITSSPCWEDSAVRSHKFVTCIQSSFGSGDQCKHLYCDVLPLVVRISPAAPWTAPLAGYCYSGQHPLKTPWCTRWDTTTAKRNHDCVVTNKTPWTFLSLKFAVIYLCSC